MRALPPAASTCISCFLPCSLQPPHPVPLTTQLQPNYLTSSPQSRLYSAEDLSLSQALFATRYYPSHRLRLIDRKPPFAPLRVGKEDKKVVVIQHLPRTHCPRSPYRTSERLFFFFFLCGASRRNPHTLHHPQARTQLVSNLLPPQPQLPLLQGDSFFPAPASYSRAFSHRPFGRVHKTGFFARPAPVSFSLFF